MMAFLQNFHFLRPWLLLFLIPAAGMIGYAARRDGSAAMRALIAPHLLRHLLVDTGRSRSFPLTMLAAFWTIAILAVSGPTWEQEPTPFTQDAAGLVIVLKVAPTMLAKDVQPSRLTRATQKIHDLLARRPGARTALIAYSGSSHLVMPFTTDPGIIDMFSQALSPDVMPDEGDDPVAALDQAAALIEQAGIAGSILLIADSLPPAQLPKVEHFHSRTKVPTQWYAMAAPKGVRVPADSPPAPPLNLEAWEKAASAAGADLTVVSVDDRDIERLAKEITTRLTAAKENTGRRWRDMGYWALPLLVLIALFFSRRGWMVAYD